MSDTGFSQLQTTAELPDLSQYDDYRSYLATVIDGESKMAHGLSMSRFAEAFGMGRSALSMILAGKRDLTLSAIHRVARALRLDPSDHAILESLVLKTQASGESERSFYEHRLHQQRSQRKTYTLSTPSKTLVSEWFVPALLVFLIDVSDDPTAFLAAGEKLGLTSEEMNRLQDSLKAEGFLAHKGKGNVHVCFNRVAAMISTRRYLRSVFVEGTRRSDRDFDDPHSFFASHCFSIHEGDISRFICDYKELLSRYMESVPSSTSPSSQPRIVQVNVQFFPVV